MVKRKVTVTNASGLHARPASMFVKEAKKYKSSLTIKTKGKEKDGKSIMGILSCAICQNTEIELIFEGEEEDLAADALAELVESGFGE